MPKIAKAPQISEADKERNRVIEANLKKVNEELKNKIQPSANGNFDDNPLFFVNSEYPKYKVLNERNRFMFDYEFYVDKAGNRYMVLSDTTETTYLILMQLLVQANWNMARNVDTFVENVDKESYARWLELIS